MGVLFDRKRLTAPGTIGGRQRRHLYFRLPGFPPRIRLMPVTSFHTMPHPQPIEHSAARDCEPGLTLLDYFAGVALQGIIASTHNCSPEACARAAYQYGLAMIGAREAMEAAQSRDDATCDPLRATDPDRSRFTT